MSQYDRTTYNRKPGPLYNTSRVRLSNVSTVTPVVMEANATGTGSIFVNFTFVNTTATATWISVYITSTGTTTPSSADLLYSKAPLDPNESIEAEKKLTLLPGDVVWVLAGAAGVNVWANLEVEI